MSLQWLLPTDTERQAKDLRNRVQAYLSWAEAEQVTVFDLRLEDYSRYLLEARQFAPNSVRAHVSTLRGRLSAMLEDKTLQRQLAEQHYSPDDIERIIGRVHEALTAPIEPAPPRQQPRHKHLTTADIQQLLDRLDVSTLTGLRDAALIALMVCTGIREQEVRALDMGDLVQEVNGERMLHVPKGVGCTERLIPYGKRAWVLQIVQAWLQAAGITEGAVFRGFYKTGKRVRKTRLSSQSIEDVLAGYPIIINDKPVTLKPLDLRHAFARYLYEWGVSLNTLSDYLGVKSASTIMRYLGRVRSPGRARVPLQFDLEKLDRWLSDT